VEVLKAQDEAALQFKDLSNKLSVLLATEGIDVKPYVNGLPFFSSLSIGSQQAVNEHLKLYYSLCCEQLSEGYQLSDGASFLWRALRRLGLVPRSDLFQHFTKDSVIEIYSFENKQLFRNINFFKFCSYTLEELHAVEWWRLFQRDDSITQRLYGYAAQIFNGERANNFIPDVSKHTVYELASADKLVMEINFNIMGPLKRNHQTEALIVAEDVRIVEKQQSVF